MRKDKGYSQEDMIGFGFSARHWQQVEAGRPITLTTLLRICEALDVRLTGILAGVGWGGEKWISLPGGGGERGFFTLFGLFFFVFFSGAEDSNPNFVQG